MNTDEAREARESDLPGIMELYKQLVQDNILQETKEASSIWKKILAMSDNVRYFVAEKNGMIISTCNIAIIPNLTHGGRPFAVIENVVTHAEHRKEGHGRSVMLLAIAFARSRNCYKVVLTSGAKRKEAHRFYRKLGFSDTDKIGFVMHM